jgi:hypothetical protein
MRDEPEFAELEALAARAVPRLDPKYGRCRVCRLPWTMPFQWEDVWYGRCVPCDTYGLIGERAFDGYNADVDDDEPEAGLVMSPEELQRMRDDFLYAGLLELARATRVEPLFTTGAETMKKSEPAPNNAPLTLEDTISRAERLPPGDASWRQSIEEARAAVEQIHTTARTTICPPMLEPTTADVLADFEALIRPISPIESAVAPLLEMHVISFPALAAVIRGARGQGVVRRHARNQRAGMSPEAVAAYEEAQLDLFSRALAAQRREDPDFRDAARVLLEDVPAYRSRLAAVEGKHVDHETAAAELARQEQARIEAEQQSRRDAEEAKRGAERLRAEDDEARDRRRSLASWFLEYGTGPWTFLVNGERVSGKSCSEALLRGGEFAVYYRASHTGTSPRMATR